MIERSEDERPAPPESEVALAEDRRRARRDRLGAACAVGFVVAIAVGLWLAQVSRIAALIVAVLALVPGWWGFKTLTDVGPKETGQETDS